MNAPGDMRVEVLADARALAVRVAGWMVEKAGLGSEFSVALAGGTTPRGLYETLAGEPFRTQLDWARTYWFWGDERFVPAGAPANNAGMARTALLSHVPVPAGHIHPIQTGLADATAAALAYERTLRAFASRRGADDGTLFDVTLLGLGEDGHTASLFPADPALAERELWVTCAHAPAGDARITLTIPTLERSRAIAFLVCGENKRAILQQFLRGDASLPATHVHPSGSITVFCDAGAHG